MLALLLVPGVDGSSETPKKPPIKNGRVFSDTVKAAVDKAIGELDCPAPHIFHANESFIPTKRDLPNDYYLNCADAIDLLIDTKSDVNEDLFNLARTTKSLRVRYRVAFILTQRSCDHANAILEEMCASDNPKERYLAWHERCRALSAKKLEPPRDFKSTLELHAVEKDKEVRDQIESFWGQAKAKEAVPVLIKQVQADPGYACPAIWALGEIGDPKAVPTLIKAFETDGNRHYHLEALGKLATPEAVDFIIEHLDEYGAVEALYESKSDKALPALEKHLEHLKEAGRKRDEMYIRATRIAIVRLRNKDPREQLLRIAEDEEEHADMRFGALRALQDYDAAAVESRILKIYTGSRDVDIKRCCIWLLENGKADGITPAMLDHVLNCEGSENQDMGATKYYLCEALSKRLNKKFRKFEDLQVYAESVKKESGGSK
jgi:hypothetical protein